MRLYKVINHVKEYRIKNNMTQKELAQKLGLSKNAISSFERGSYSLSASVAAQMCILFECTFNDLIEIVMDPQNDEVNNERYE